MTKTKLETFIKKYSLGGTLDEVRWLSKDKTLKVAEMTPDKKLLVMVEMTDFDAFGDAEFVMPDTLSFKSKLAPIKDDLKINLNCADSENRIISLEVSDDRNELTFHTGMDDHLPPKPKLMNIPDYDVEIILTDEFKDGFLKNGFNDVNLFTLIMSKKRNKLDMVIGYNSSINTNKIALGITCVEGKDKVSSPISFSANVLKEILNANSEVKDPILKVSEQGLAYIECKSEGFNSQYYLIKIPVED